MDSNARKQLNLIKDVIKRNKLNTKNRFLIKENTVTCTEAKNGDKAGVFINRETLINLIKNSNNESFQVSYNNSISGITFSIC